MKHLTRVVAGALIDSVLAASVLVTPNTSRAADTMLALAPGGVSEHSLMPTESSDLAMPLDRRNEIDSPQLLVETRRSF